MNEFQSTVDFLQGALLIVLWGMALICAIRSRIDVATFYLVLSAVAMIANMYFARAIVIR